MQQTPSDPLDTALSGPQAAAQLAAQMAAGGAPLVTGTADKPFANMLCFSVYAAQLAFNRLYKQLLAPHGLTYLQYLVLVALAQAEDRTVGELGDVLFLESNTLTPLLKRMEAAALVVRRRDAKWGEVPVAFISRRDEHLSETDIEAVCRKSLAGYKRPKEVHFMRFEDFPRSTTGKILRHEMERKFL